MPQLCLKRRIGRLDQGSVGDGIVERFGVDALGQQRCSVDEYPRCLVQVAVAVHPACPLDECVGGRALGEEPVKVDVQGYLDDLGGDHQPR